MFKEKPIIVMQMAHDIPHQNLNSLQHFELDLASEILHLLPSHQPLYNSGTGLVCMFGN